MGILPLVAALSFGRKQKQMFKDSGSFELSDEELENIEPPYQFNYIQLLKKRGAPITGNYIPVISDGYLIGKQYSTHKASTKISWRLKD